MTAIGVDAFLQQPKTLIGQPAWKRGSRPNQYRLVWDIAPAGQIPRPRLEILHAAGAPNLKLNIGLYVPTAIARLEIDDLAEHRNKGESLPPGLPRIVSGHHYHAWDMNRRFATRSTLPIELPWAKPWDVQEVTMEIALQWFCQEHRIRLGQTLIPPLAARETCS